MKKKDIIEGKIIKTEFPNKGTFICEDQKVTVKGVINGQRIKGQVTKKKWMLFPLLYSKEALMSVEERCARS